MKKLIFTASLLGSMFLYTTANAESYKFTVENTTKTRIVKLLVSEDGKKWNQFDIGKGIEPGEKATMAWNESTNDQDCEQKVKAEYADGSESEVAQFDFCEAGLGLEF